MISALKELANLITMNMTPLTATLARSLAETQYSNPLVNDTFPLARTMLRTVINTLEGQSSQPLIDLFQEPDPRYRFESPTLAVEILGKVLTPVAPNLEAGKFLWGMLADVRLELIADHTSLIATIQEERIDKVTPQPPMPNRSNNNTPPHLSRISQVTMLQATEEVKSEPSLDKGGANFDAEQITRTALSIARLAHVRLTIESTLVDLPVYAFQVEADSLVQEVEKLLRIHTILPGVIITRQGLAVGVISRRKFFEQLGQLYGVAVFMRRSIRLMLTKINAEPLLLPASCPIPEAVDLALNRPSNFVFEPIIVELAPHIYRLLDVYTLLMAQSKLFAHLQTQLQIANVELEARVAQRTAELVQANADLTQEIAKRREVEGALIVARDQALAASRFKSELLTKVSHELRTPLGAIIGHAEMLQMGLHGPISNKQNQTTAKIIDNANYLTDLVGHLLDQAQYEAGKLLLKITTFTPSDVVEDVVSRLAVTAQQKGLTLKTEIGSGLPARLYGDPVALQQILVNLVSNAVKYTDQGRVCVRLFCFDDQHWAIEVADTGPGISPENQARIFEPFGQIDSSMTRRHAGVGLGLSIVKQLTVLMGGQIQLESQVDQGSSFRIILPLKPVDEVVV
ncbi:MAG: hypothetical protein H6631_14965 [Anaerolineaceae bacterium]|nr:hypothetical protein [Anaerolineaceae bacterium]MCB9099015.1 hypothetical protein [Anaerolineales bacterium]